MSRKREITVPLLLCYETVLNYTPSMAKDGMMFNGTGPLACLSLFPVADVDKVS